MSRRQFIISWIALLVITLGLGMKICCYNVSCDCCSIEVEVEVVEQTKSCCASCEEPPSSPAPESEEETSGPCMVNHGDLPGGGTFDSMNVDMALAFVVEVAPMPVTGWQQQWHGLPYLLPPDTGPPQSLLCSWLF